jgi:serine/threonine protein kinase
VLGTASYMSPEQLDGHRPSPASDIYSLATVAFEALTGAKARRGRTPIEIAHSVANEPPPDLREHWQHAPAAAAEILKCGMSRDRVDRPETACELANELAEALEGEDRAPSRPRVSAPAPPPTPPPPVQVARPRRRRVPSLLPLALLALALLAGGVIALSSGGGDEKAAAPAKKPAPQHKPKPKPKPQPQPATGGSSPAPATTPPPPATSPSTPSDGASLNSQGFRLMSAGRYDEAVPVLRRAVAAFPSGSTDLNYAYALFNLGKALRLSGRPAEAVPILERRLRIPNQTETVQRELDLARRAAR